MINYYCIKGELEPRGGTFIGSISFDVDNTEIGPSQIVVHPENEPAITFDHNGAELSSSEMIFSINDDEYYLEVVYPTHNFISFEFQMNPHPEEIHPVSIMYQNSHTGKRIDGHGSMIYDPSQGSKDCSASFEERNMW